MTTLVNVLGVAMILYAIYQMYRLGRTIDRLNRHIEQADQMVRELDDQISRGRDS